VKITTSSSGGAVWYAPDFEDNRDKDEDHQAAVLLTPLKGSELVKLEHSKLLTRKEQQSKDVYGTIEMRQWALKMKCLSKHVEGLRNWFHEDKDSGTETKIETFAELKKLILDSDNAVLLGILSDIFNAAIDASVLTEGTIKN
jgi:hypothetical protein